MSSLRNDTRRRIEIAFAETPYPGDQNITPHECSECAAIRNALKGTDWHDWIEAPVAELRRHAVLPLFSPEALRYFLPAFLIAVIREPGPAQWILEQFLYALNPQEEDRRRSTKAFLKILNIAQIDALTAFVDWTATELPEYISVEDIASAKATLRQVQ